MIIMFIGPSSSGKDYFYEKMLEHFDFEKIVLYTTRPIRTGEVNGREYFFITKEEMEKLERENKLVEKRDYNTALGIWTYATRGDNIDKNKIYLVINTWEGYQKYLNYFGDDFVKPIYFDVDPDIRFERAYNRETRQTEKKYLELCRRFIADSEDFTENEIIKYDPIIIDNNGKIEETSDQLKFQIKRLIKNKIN